MKFTIASLLALGATLATAQSDSNQTAAFYLKLVSDDTSLNNHYLYSCHAGAAIEGLCIDDDDKANLTYINWYLQNYTEYNDYNGHPTGSLIWNLPIDLGNGVVNVSSGMDLSFNLVSNTAVPLFYPGSSGYFGIGFDSDEEMFIVSFGDDTQATDDGTYPPRNATAYYRWHVCNTFVGGYYYRALAWITTGTAVNPTCKSVKVLREWV